MDFCSTTVWPPPHSCKGTRSYLDPEALAEEHEQGAEINGQALFRIQQTADAVRLVPKPEAHPLKQVGQQHIHLLR